MKHEATAGLCVAFAVSVIGCANSASEIDAGSASKTEAVNAQALQPAQNTKMPIARPSRTKPYPGEIRHSSGGFDMASSYRAWRRFASLVGAGDDIGIKRMERARSLVWVTGQFRVIQKVGNAWEIRMLDGPFAGQSGWSGETTLTSNSNP